MRLLLCLLCLPILSACDIHLHKSMAEIRAVPETRIASVTRSSGGERVSFRSPYGAYSEPCDCVLGKVGDTVVSVAATEIASVETVRPNPWLKVLGVIGVVVGVIITVLLVYPRQPTPG